MTNENIRPRFQVVKLKGKVTRNIAEKTATGIIFKEKEEPAGYMVHLPNKSSIRVRNLQELERLGFTNDIEQVDMTTGDVVGKVPNRGIELESHPIS
jgi:hypothetical protein